MTYARHTSPIWHLPIHSFPGDDQYSLAEYERAVFGGYVSSISTLFAAANVLDISIDDETFERSKRAASAAGLIDDFLDNGPDINSANELYQQQLNRYHTDDMPTDVVDVGDVDERLPIAIGLLRNSTADLPEKQRSETIDAAARIGALAVEKSQCDNVHAYQGLLVAEAVDTAALIGGMASEKVKAHRQTDRFLQWCSSALMFAIMADSLRDLGDDYRSGRTNVYPSISAKRALFSATRKSAKFLYRGSGQRQMTMAALAARRKFSMLPTKYALSHKYLQD